MNRRSFLQLIAAVPVIAVAVTAHAAPHKSIRPNWSVIDRRKVGSTAETVSFVHRSGIDPAGAFRIMARGQAIWLKSVKLTYRGGATQIHQFNINIPPGASSPSFLLADDSSLLRRIDISLNALPLAGGTGEILVWSVPEVDLIHTATE